jgi:hypothetical protein
MKKLLFGWLLFTVSLLLNAQNNVLIGAYYFDGWSGHNSMDEKWVKQSNAPTGLTYKLMTVFPEREPVWGWRDDDIRIMERQIDLAAKNGVDFFVFCWYWKRDGNGNVSDTQVKALPHHTSMKLFMQAKNKHKMKFAVLVCDHSGEKITNQDSWNSLIGYLSKEYFSDSQYLRFDNKPYLCFFQGGAANAYLDGMRATAQTYGLEGVVMASCNYHVPESKFDVTSFYNETIETGKIGEARPYSELISRTEYFWPYQPVNSIPSCIVGWDKRPWFEKEDFIYYNNKTPEQFYKLLTDAIDFTYKRKPQFPAIMIFAWNELGEGGYLVPTKGDRRAKFLKQIKRVKKYEKKKYLK